MFAKNLRVAMEERRITLTELAGITGISKSGISQYLSGKVTPKSDFLVKLADALDVTVEWLLAVHTEDEEAPTGRMTVSMAAKMLGKSEQFVRVALQNATAPFGFAVRMPSGRWSYHISPKRITEYIG